MSLCLRTFPNKFTSYVNTRKQVRKIDRHLPKHAKSSLFLKKFLGTQTPASIVNYTEKSVNLTLYLVDKNLPIVYHDQATEWPKILHKRNNWNRQQDVWLQKQRQKSVQTLNTIHQNIMNKAIVNNSTQWSKLYINNNSFYKNTKSCMKTLPVNRTLDSILQDSEKQNILYSEVSPNVETEKQPSDDRKPSETQLQEVYDNLSKELPLLFVKAMDYSIYTQDLVFINNIRGITTTGLVHYIKQIAFLKIIGHLKFAYVKLDLLKITMHPEDSSVKVRWRIIGISGTYVFLAFWKFKLWNVKELINDKQAWYDGFSTFYVNQDGKVFKHVVDKLMPDQDSCEKVKTPVGAKLALFTTLLGSDCYNCSRPLSKVISQLTKAK